MSGINSLRRNISGTPSRADGAATEGVNRPVTLVKGKVRTAQFCIERPPAPGQPASTWIMVFSVGGKPVRWDEGELGKKLQYAMKHKLPVVVRGTYDQDHLFQPSSVEVGKPRGR